MERTSTRSERYGAVGSDQWTGEHCGSCRPTVSHCTITPGFREKENIYIHHLPIKKSVLIFQFVVCVSQSYGDSVRFKTRYDETSCECIDQCNIIIPVRYACQSSKYMYIHTKNVNVMPPEFWTPPQAWKSLSRVQLFWFVFVFSSIFRVDLSYKFRNR